MRRCQAFDLKSAFLCTRALLFGLLVCTFPAHSVHAQNVPSSIRLIVPFPAGGLVDLAARLLSEEMQKDLGATVVVENRPGASGAIGARAVKNADPDGRVLLFTSSGVITINPVIMKDAGYEPTSDFRPVAMTALTDIVFVVGPKVKSATLKEFVQEAKAENNPFPIGSAGTGNPTHGYLELFKQDSGIDFLHVPYRGGAPAMTDVLSGNVVGAVVGVNVALPHIRSGAVRALAVVGDKRSEALPNVPTFMESGFPSLNILTWVGLLAPKDTPSLIVDAIAASASRVLSSSNVKSRLNENGLTPTSVTPAQFQSIIAEESNGWKKAF